MTRERDRGNLSRDSGDNSVNNDNNYSITNEQIAQSDELTQRWKRINKRRSYTEKALFRANQENLVKKFGDSKNNESVSVEEIKSVLEGCNDTFEKIQLRGASGREMVQDARILTGLANNLITQTQKNLAANSRYFRLGNFVRHLHNTLLQNKSKPIFTKGNPLLEVDEKIESDIKLEKEVVKDDVPTLTKSDWKRIAKFADLVPRPRSLSYILAIFSENMAPGEKKIKRARGKREAKEQAVVLSQRDKIDHTKNEASISKELEHVKECLRIALRNGNGVVSYFAFVIDPKSFGKTIENIFHTSFLIKDFYAQLDLNEKGLLEISELDDVEREVLRRKADESSNQAVMKFDHSVWSAMIETLEITNVMIPQRKIELE